MHVYIFMSILRVKLFKQIETVSCLLHESFLFSLMWTWALLKGSVLKSFFSVTLKYQLSLFFIKCRNQKAHGEEDYFSYHILSSPLVSWLGAELFWHQCFWKKHRKDPAENRKRNAQREHQRLSGRCHRKRLLSDTIPNRGRQESLFLCQVLTQIVK